jgi:predicted Rossmann fold nucleotide-binding protein DprA/Smf involved in DNA uptake
VLTECRSSILAALYLPGLRRPLDPPRRKWRQVDHICRSQGFSALADSGLGEEAFVLGRPGLLEHAMRLLAQGVTVTAGCPTYPAQWSDRLGEGAPPALWQEGLVSRGRYVGIVGSREVPPRLSRFAAGVAAEARRLGFLVVSGGAAGCDRASRPDLEIVPYGLESRCCGVAALRRCGGAARLSLAAPDAEFSAALAMERNGLIYSLSEATVVVEARFKQGGSWAGAVEALRRKRCRVIVREDPSSPAMRALIALGAIPLREPAGLAEAMAAPQSQGLLFAADSAGCAGTISA